MFFKTKENSSEGVPVFLTNLFKLDPDPHFKAAGSGSTALCSRGSSFTFTAGNSTVLVPLLDDLQSPVSTIDYQYFVAFYVCSTGKPQYYKAGAGGAEIIMPCSPCEPAVKRIGFLIVRKKFRLLDR